MRKIILIPIYIIALVVWSCSSARSESSAYKLLISKDDDTITLKIFNNGDKTIFWTEPLNGLFYGHIIVEQSNNSYSLVTKNTKAFIDSGAFSISQKREIAPMQYITYRIKLWNDLTELTHVGEKPEWSELHDTKKECKLHVEANDPNDISKIIYSNELVLQGP